MKEIKLTEKRFWKVINDWDDPNHNIEDNTDCIYYITITKKEIEAENIDRVLKLLNLLLGNLRSLFSFVHKINIDIIGYESDPRDLWEIEEVRNFMQLLDVEFPYWFYFLNQSKDSFLPILTLCLCDYRKRSASEYCIIKNAKLHDFLYIHLKAMTVLFEETRFPKRVIEATVTYPSSIIKCNT